MKADNLGLVAAAFNVDTAIAVAVFALDSLLGVIGMALRRGVFCVAGCAYFTTRASSTGDFHALTVEPDPIGRVFGGWGLPVSG
jgi:hypothetical protein